MSEEEAKRKKLEALKKLFLEMDRNADHYLSYDELYDHLSKKSGKKFNDELLSEVFRTIDRDKSSTVTLDEFIGGYNKAELIILDNIKRLKAQISEMSENYIKTQRNLVEAKAKKIQNLNENNLYIIVKKAEGLKAGGVTGNKAPMVCITCEGREIQTSAVFNPTNPEWNQSFTFPVTQGVGDILIEVYDTERGKKTTLLGEVAIPIRALDNQELHEDYLELKGRSSIDRVQGKILVALQWIHDLPVYLQNMIKEYENALKLDKEELESLESYLRELNGPLRPGSLPEWVKNNENIESLERAFSTNVNTLFTKTLGQKYTWPFVTRFSVYLFMLLSTISCLCRADGLNVRFRQVTLAVVGFWVYTRQIDVPINFRLVFVGIVLAEVLDVVWMVMYYVKNI
jgi:hypothetical protein